jgi:XTP/dITP diphosphohydrolase/tetrapyrrole methylase family protein/MazG family protein/ATP diphosphatase
MADQAGLAEALADLQQLAERLRRECPWDRAQTTRTIVPHTVEEAYEVAEAALAEDDVKLLDELGDLLFQVYFLALLLDERGQGSLADVSRRIHDKLVRRHPHVFETPGELDSPGEVKHRWEHLKAEQEEREGIFHHVPEVLPALLYARKVQRRAAAVGFDYPDVAATLADIDDELAELRAELEGKADPAPETEPDPRVAAELGDVLFGAANVARRLNVDPELELRRATDRFRARVEEAERLANEDGRAWVELSLDEQDRYFDRAKERQ